MVIPVSRPVCDSEEASVLRSVRTDRKTLDPMNTYNVSVPDV